MSIEEQNIEQLDPSQLSFRMIVKDGKVIQLFESVGITRTKHTLFQGTLDECVKEAFDKDYEIDLEDFGIEYSDTTVEIPTMTDLKSDIIEFMNAYSIDYLESDTKQQLIDKINQHLGVTHE